MIIKGPYPDISIPETALTPFVMHRAHELGDKPALIDGPSGRTLLTNSSPMRSALWPTIFPRVASRKATSAAS
jgi:hypothetical protein